MTTAELEYPGPWLLGWVDILRRAPGGNEMPRVEVVPRGDGKVWGRYLMDDHVVRLYPDARRPAALATLLHELAHALAPYERAKHGPRWRETFARLFAWLTGIQIDLAGLPAYTKASITTLDDRPVRLCDAALAFALDTLLEDKLEALAPRITMESPDGRTRALLAVVGDRRRCTFNITEAT